MLREPADPNRTPTSRGVLLFDAIGDEPMTTEDLGYFAEACTENWGADFTKPGSPDLRRCFLVWKQAQEQGWGSTEFRRAVSAFLLRTTFPTWTLADFFEYKRPKVYGHAWMRENWARLGAEGIGTYEIAGRPVWGLRSECDGLLPVWEAEHVPDESPEIEAQVSPDEPTTKRDFMSPAVREDYNRVMADLGAGIKLEEAEEQLRRARSELVLETKTIDALRAENDELKKQVQNLTDLLHKRAEAGGTHG